MSAILVRASLPASTAAPAAASRRRWLQAIRPSGRSVAIGVPYAILLLFFLAPFLVVIKISLAEPVMGVPPYSELISWKDSVLNLTLHLEHYQAVFADNLYVGAYLTSLKVAAVSTLICLLIGYPAAYFMARAEPASRHLLLMAVMLPFWTSYLIRVYAWIGILKDQGLLNGVLMGLHLIDTPLRLFHTQWGVYIGMVYSYLPYLVLPLYAHLVKMDLTLLEAAHDLGARPWKAFVTITLPLSMRGVVAGCLLVFIPSVGEYVIPELLGGAESILIGRVMWDDFFNNTNWPVASAAACVMVGLLLLPIALFQHLQARDEVRP